VSPATNPVNQCQSPRSCNAYPYLCAWRFSSCRRVRAGLLSGLGPRRLGAAPSIDKTRRLDSRSIVAGLTIHLPRVTFLGPAKILKNSVPKVPLVGVSGCAEAEVNGTRFPVNTGSPGAEKLAGEVEAMMGEGCELQIELECFWGREARGGDHRWKHPPPDRTRSHRKHGRKDGASGRVVVEIDRRTGAERRESLGDSPDNCCVSKG
jgi:hypothetical protein